MYKFTYQVLDFNTEEDRFVVLVKTTDSKVAQQEEVIHIDYTEDYLMISSDNETFFPAWERQFEEATRDTTTLDFIDDLIESHFKTMN